jgi:hypothetical protein
MKKLSSGTPIAFAIIVDDWAHDVRTDVLDLPQINSAHPMEITTGDVEQSLDLESAEHVREPFRHNTGLFVVGARSRQRCLPAPKVLVIEFCENPLDPFAWGSIVIQFIEKVVNQISHISGKPSAQTKAL